MSEKYISYHTKQWYTAKDGQQKFKNILQQSVKCIYFTEDATWWSDLMKKNSVKSDENYETSKQSTHKA